MSTNSSWKSQGPGRPRDFCHGLLGALACLIRQGLDSAKNLLAFKGVRERQSVDGSRGNFREFNGVPVDALPYFLPSFPCSSSLSEDRRPEFLTQDSAGRSWNHRG